MHTRPTLFDRLLIVGGPLAAFVAGALIATVGLARWTNARFDELWTENAARRAEVDARYRTLAAESRLIVAHLERGLPEDRRAALGVLLARGDRFPGALPSLGALLDDEGPLIRAGAVLALGRQARLADTPPAQSGAPTVALDLLTPYFEAASSTERLAALFAVQDAVGVSALSPRARAALAAIYDDERAPVRERTLALRALRREENGHRVEWTFSLEEDGRLLAISPRKLAATIAALHAFDLRALYRRRHVDHAPLRARLAGDPSALLDLLAPSPLEQLPGFRDLVADRKSHVQLVGLREAVANRIVELKLLAPDVVAFAALKAHDPAHAHTLRVLSGRLVN